MAICILMWHDIVELEVYESKKPCSSPLSPRPNSDDSTIFSRRWRIILMIMFLRFLVGMVHIHRRTEAREGAPKASRLVLPIRE
jgi:hypothetical protein